MSLIRDRRAENIDRLQSEHWDVLIVGGGINGAGIARDLTLREPGLRIALIEKNHFASGTSGRNSQLIHGGLRYLKYMDFGLVKEALRERAVLLKIAPQLVQPLEFLIPCYGRFDRWFYAAGLTVYDALAAGRSLGHHRKVSAGELADSEPGLDSQGLRAGLYFFDARVNAARLVLENILDAEARGACVANYVEADWGGRTVQARDRLSGATLRIRARRIVDATGAWSHEASLRLVRGSHLIFPRIQAGNEAIAHFDDRGRIVFLIPWGENDDLTLVGTTDEDHTGGPDSVRISEAETVYLTSIVRRLFPSFRREPVASYSSLRPLIAETGRSATSTSREHRIWESSDGVLHIAGGKYTTYRAMSEELVDMLSHKPCLTAVTPIPIPEIPDTPMAAGERVRLAVEREFARTLPDLLYVSTYWGHERVGRDWIEPLATQMADLLGWDRERLEAEINSCAPQPLAFL